MEKKKFIYAKIFILINFKNMQKSQEEINVQSRLEAIYNKYADPEFCNLSLGEYSNELKPWSRLLLIVSKHHFTLISVGANSWTDNQDMQKTYSLLLNCLGIIQKATNFSKIEEIKAVLEEIKKHKTEEPTEQNTEEYENYIDKLTELSDKYAEIFLSEETVEAEFYKAIWETYKTIEKQ